MELNRIIPLVISLIVGLATNGLYDILLPLLPLGKSSGLSMKGIWLSSFSPEAGQHGHLIEIFKIQQRGDKILFTIENYNSQRARITRLKGQGRVSASQLSAYYYHANGKNPDNGTFTLKIKSTQDGGVMLAGVYTEVIDREHESFPIPVSQEVTMYKTELPIGIQLRTIVGQSYFRNYLEAKKYFKLDNQPTD